MDCGLTEGKTMPLSFRTPSIWFRTCHTLCKQANLPSRNTERRVPTMCSFHGEKQSSEEDPFRKPEGHWFCGSDGVSTACTLPMLWPSELGDRRREGLPSPGVRVWHDQDYVVGLSKMQLGPLFPQVLENCSGTSNPEAYGKPKTLPNTPRKARGWHSGPCPPQGSHALCVCHRADQMWQGSSPNFHTPTHDHSCLTQGTCQHGKGP